MLRYFLLVIGILLALVLGLGYFTKADPKKLALALRYVGGITVLGLALILMTRGLVVYAVPLAVLGYALLQGRMPFSTSFPGTGKSTGQQSRVRTATIEMRLDHDSGDMEGLVLKGKFANRMLSDLELDELLELWEQCRRYDGQAAKLLEAYIDRAHPEWREMAGEPKEGQAAGAGGGHGGSMSVEEAYEILGLAPGAGESDIHRAHRNLMKKLHPDQGGSTYLASKINEAKDLLLKRR